jgi:hypothetical protein
LKVVSSIGTLSMQELRTPDVIKKAGEGVAKLQASQLETNREKNSMPPANLTSLIQEAQKRAENRRKSSDKRKRKMALNTYQNLKDFEEVRETFGLNLDRQV